MAWERSSFEDGRLPKLVYIGPIQLHEAHDTVISHPGYAELMLVRVGSGTAEIDGRTEHIGPGDFVLCSAGEPHSLSATAAQPLQGVACGFAELFVRGMEENTFVNHQEQQIVHTGVASRPLDDILTALESVWVDPTLQNTELIRLLSAAAVSTALQLQRSAAERAEQAHYELGVRTRLYLDRHYLEPLTLDDLAHAMGVSKYHLDRVFRSSAGCSPIQYIIRRRMARAQTLLVSTNQTVQHIAAQCGYTNYNYFTVLFRRTVGKTPGEYRKSMQGRPGRRGS